MLYYNTELVYNTNSCIFDNCVLDNTRHTSNYHYYNQQFNLHLLLFMVHIHYFRNWDVGTKTRNIQKISIAKEIQSNIVRFVKCTMETAFNFPIIMYKQRKFLVDNLIKEVEIW